MAEKSIQINVEEPPKQAISEQEMRLVQMYIKASPPHRAAIEAAAEVYAHGGDNTSAVDAAVNAALAVAGPVEKESVDAWAHGLRREFGLAA
jgi:hypothetical protein